MGINVSRDEKEYNVSVTPQLKQILTEISRHNEETTAHRALISEISLKANQSTTYNKTEINDLLTALPTLDLSGQIGTHDTDIEAHEDIRSTILSEIIRATNVEATKVDKIEGKSLSSNDFTNIMLTRLNNQSGTNTGDETLVTILSKLGGTGIKSICTCSTASATIEKIVTLNGFTLNNGATILVKFTNSNTASAPTLNVNSTGAKAIYNEAGTAVSTTNPAYFPAGASVEFTYDGTNWVYKKRIVENYVNDYAWYRVYSDGWIEQGGKTNGGLTTETVTFLKPFKTTKYTPFAIDTTLSAGNTCVIGAPTTTQIPILSTSSYSKYWEAKGY